MSNFSFLQEKWPALSKLGEFAEKYIYQDSNTTFIKLGMFGETIVKYIIKLEDVDEILKSHDKSQVNRIKLLKKEDVFRGVELIEEARRDLIMNVNYNYALKNLMLKIGG